MIILPMFGHEWENWYKQINKCAFRLITIHRIEVVRNSCSNSRKLLLSLAVLASISRDKRYHHVSQTFETNKPKLDLFFKLSTYYFSRHHVCSRSDNITKRNFNSNYFFKLKKQNPTKCRAIKTYRWKIIKRNELRFKHLGFFLNSLYWNKPQI